MTLEEAYTALRLQPALEFEADNIVLMRGSGAPVDVCRGVGSTTRMLVEAALDLAAGLHVLVLQPTGKDVRGVRTRLIGMARAVGASEHQERNFRVQLTAEVLTGDSSDIWYTDHCRDPVEGDDRRILGPLGWARSVVVSRVTPDSYDVFDRDRRLLATVTSGGLAELRRRHYTAIQGP